MSKATAVGRSRESAARPSVSALTERARSFQQQLLDRGAATERDRRISPDIMGELEIAGLLNLVRAERHGGFGYGPSVLVRIGMELGQGCGSTAWAAMLANCNSWFASYWPEEAQCQIWAENPAARIAGTVVPTGQAELVAGGFSISGRWPFASNCENSDWAFVSAIVHGCEDVAAGATWFLVPMTDLQVDQDSWFVTGMQGTGSKTLYVEEPIFVPQYRTIRFDEIATRRVPGCSIPGNTPSMFAFSTFGATALVGPILGMAQGALTCFVNAMKEKLRVTMAPGAKVSAGSDPFVQESVGRASAMIGTAATALLTKLEEAELRILAGGDLSEVERIAIRRSLVFASTQALEATNLVATMAGASAADSKLPLQRFWRDINAAGRHASLDRNGVMSMVGRNMLGLPPQGAF